MNDGAGRGAWVVPGPVCDADVGGLCERLQVLLLAGELAEVVCDVGALAADGVAVDTLARLALTAGRVRRRIRFESVSPELGRLIAFVGLDDRLLGDLGSGREAEERKQARGVEEGVDRRDPPP